MLARKFIFSFLFLFLFITGVKATHNRAGEITYKRIAPFSTVVGGVTVQVFTYSITVILYTADGQFIADRCIDTLYFGDNQREVINRVNGLTFGCDCNNFTNKPVGCGVLIIDELNYKVKQNIYTTIHTYPGAGTYTIHTADPNRNKDVHNMTSSVNQPFYIESLLIIDNFTGANTSPQFSFPPIDKACVNVCFEHNPGAFDIDGDSLSYEITTSRTYSGETVPGYFFPETGTGGTFGINAITGLLTWCAPTLQAEYNIAFIVREWRKNTSGDYYLVGFVLRDMQVIVDVCPFNQPPVVDQIPPICIEAGKTLSKEFSVFDPNSKQEVTLLGGGGAFSGNAPLATIFPTVGIIADTAGKRYTSTFSWQTNCNHVRSLPYFCTIKASDNGLGNENKLVSFMTFQIRVVPPAITGLTATPSGSTMKLTWDPSSCNPSTNKIVAYQIYRKDNCTPVVFDPCNSDDGPGNEYKLVGSTSASITNFVDDNKQNGLVVGQSYGYIVIVKYEDGLKSFVGTQLCAELTRDVPIFTMVDVLSTSVKTGSIELRWLPPLTTPGNLDLSVFKGPYRYTLLRRATGNNGAFASIFTSTNAVLTALDLSYVDSNLNTDSVGYDYQLDFYSDTSFVGSSRKASTVFIKTLPNDRKIELKWDYSTPWNNYKFELYRRDPDSLNFRLIATTTTNTYTDQLAVINGSTYCYYVKSSGEYSDTSILRPLINRSQIDCATAVDKIPPVPPTATITADCPSGFLEVSWSDISNQSDDVGSYQVYYKPTVDGLYVPIANFMADLPRYFSSDNPNTFAGCYAVKATDINGNIGDLSEDLCVDICPIFELPNVFSANGDEVNDFFQAIRVKQIKEIDLHVLDRWGNLVYQTTDPYFKWDGISQFSKKPCSEGTFFYVCTVYEPRLRGTVKRSLHGTVQLVR